MTGGVTVFFNTDSFWDGVVMEYTGEKGLCTVGMERGNKRAASWRLKVKNPGGIEVRATPRAGSLPFCL